MPADKGSFQRNSLHLESLNRLYFSQFIQQSSFFKETMVPSISETLLWAFVINLGIACGAGLYETRVVLPQWFNKSPTAGLQVNSGAMRQTNSGLRFWAYVTTGPLTLLTLANLVIAFQSSGPRHDWWLAAALVTLLERMGTFAYFIPTAIRLMKSEATSSLTGLAMVTRWVRLNSIRELLTLIGWLLALRVLSLPV
ncbi:MAG: DUF1772 domain-containing protein [Cytophagaceae bacterium]|nr:DUF1772 domain-containing protein [Cytophagaceae bacterium]